MDFFCVAWGGLKSRDTEFMRDMNRDGDGLN
jgi:hypothetical protein